MSEALQTHETRFDFDKEPDWTELINYALNTPGSLGNTYNRFYNYSYFNQMLLLMQGVQEPVATYKRWQELGRQVQKGSHARTIMRPIFYKQEENGQEVQKLRGFKYVKCLFPVSETAGDALPPYEPAQWSPDQAMTNLGIKEVPFRLLDGNTAGYSFDRMVAINPVAPYPLKTLVHELGHIILGHTEPGKHDEYTEHRGLKEFQAEATAYIVMNELEVMEHMNASESRAYIQNWLNGNKPGDADIRQVFGAVDKILKAGRAPAEGEAYETTGA